MKLKIDLDELVTALTTRFELTEGAWYLDTETGDLYLDADGAEDLPEDLGENPRYLEVDPIPSRDGFRMMEDFVATLSDAAAAEPLARALRGHKPFRSFKDALFDLPTVRDAWFKFEEEAQRRWALQWCKDNDIEPEWR